jgi:xanthine dehydrogenase iron-sulfur cluster and FAD-binding subunit A
MKTTRNATRQELADGISGNLCRCHACEKILTAMRRGGPPEMSEFWRVWDLVPGHKM